MVQKNINVLLGETASGKTDFILKLHKKKRFEVVNCDSRQIFRGLDIGTAKPSKSILKSVKHHLIDIADINDDFTVMDFVEKADDILKGRENYLVSAGTPFYLSVLLFGMDEIPKTNKKTRDFVENLYIEKGLEFLYEELGKVDYKRYLALNKNDKQRIKRALEVYYATGKPISSFYLKKGSKKIDIMEIKYIYRDKEELRKRVEKRTQEMLNKGLFDETASLMVKYKKERIKEKGIIGYNESIEYIEGRINKGECFDLIVKNTMNYIKRQRVFFKKIIEESECKNLVRIV